VPQTLCASGRDASSITGGPQRDSCGRRAVAGDSRVEFRVRNSGRHQALPRRQQFSMADGYGIAHGTVRLKWFGSFLRHSGADEGDILVAEFDLSAGSALLRLGDDELLDEMSPEASGALRRIPPIKGLRR
jgi:hypothetical protein